MSIAAAIGDTIEEQPHKNAPKKSGRFTPYWLLLPGCSGSPSSSSCRW
jgi:hypothetical protein